MLTIDTASRTFHCKTWVTGQTQGKAVIARERISFWGGFDPQTGRIVDPYSSLRGRDISDCVLILLSSKGSSGTSGMLSLATRAGHAPAALIQVEMDPVTVMGCLVNNIPLLQATGFDPFEQIQDGDLVRIDGENGTITLAPGQA